MVAITLRALPKTSKPMVSNFKPRSSETTWAPVTVAMSVNISLRLSPKPGALTARVLKVLRKLLTTNVAKASPSTSSATITSSFLPVWATFSSNGKISCTPDIFLSVTKILGSS